METPISSSDQHHVTRSSSNYLILSPNSADQSASHEASDSASLLLESEQASQLPPELLFLLPYRKAYYAVPALALLDTGVAVAFAVHCARLHPEGVLPLVVWHFVRPVIIAQCGLSWRIREKGLITLLVSGVCHPFFHTADNSNGPKQATLLMSLWYTNAMVQRFRIYPRSSHHMFPLLLLSHLVFGIAHWLLFIGLIGVRRDVNPFGLGSLVITYSDFVAPTAHRPLLHEDESESPTRLFQGVSDGFGFDDNEEDEDSEADPDDIVDWQPIPPSNSVRHSIASHIDNQRNHSNTVRYRTSQATLK